jgi:hypothetical protein
MSEEEIYFFLISYFGSIYTSNSPGPVPHRKRSPQETPFDVTTLAKLFVLSVCCMRRKQNSAIDEITSNHKPLPWHFVVQHGSNSQNGELFVVIVFVHSAPGAFKRDSVSKAMMNQEPFHWPCRLQQKRFSSLQNRL